MPAPKAVLRDIHDLGLDPGYAHTITDKGGHLVPPSMIKAGAKHAGMHINQRTLPNSLKALPPEPEQKVEEVVVVKRSKLSATPAPAPAPAPAPEPVKAVEAVKPVEKPTEDVKPVEAKAEPKAEEKPAEEKPAS